MKKLVIAAATATLALGATACNGHAVDHVHRHPASTTVHHTVTHHTVVHHQTVVHHVVVRKQAKRSSLLKRR